MSPGLISGILRYMFFKNTELHKKYKEHGPFRKQQVTELINFRFSKPVKGKFISSKKKLLLILQILLTKRKILFNVLVGLIDQYVIFTYTETMLKNDPRKRSCRRFVRNQGWWYTVVNDYSDERLKYTFRMSRNTSQKTFDEDFKNKQSPNFQLFQK